MARFHVADQNNAIIGEKNCFKAAGSFLVAVSSFVDWLSPILLRTRLVSQAGFRKRSLRQAPCFNSPRKWGLVWNFLFDLFIWHKIIRNKQTPWTLFFSLTRVKSHYLVECLAYSWLQQHLFVEESLPEFTRLLDVYVPLADLGDFLKYCLMFWSIFLWFSLVVSIIQNTYVYAQHIHYRKQKNDTIMGT